MSAQAVRFQQVEPGIEFEHNAEGNSEGFLPSLMSGGLAVIDFDRDGRDDVYLCNGADIILGKKFDNALFRNCGKWLFQKVGSPDLAGRKLALGATSADIDDDGFRDIVVSTLGGIECLLNNGDGTFDDAGALSGLNDTRIPFGAGIVLLDIDHDGDLDLFVADYVDFSMKRFGDARAASFPYPPGPEAFPDRTDSLMENLGNGKFRDISGRLSSVAVPSPSMGAVAVDANQDGWLDIFVCSDAMPNLLYVNQTDGTFEEEALLFGLSTSASGVPLGSMGAVVQDVDGDGSEDIFVTSYSGQNPVMFKGLQADGFQDVTLAWRAGVGLFQHANWGAEFADFNNDGRTELFVANGHLLPKADEIEQMTAFKVRDTLFSWSGGRFVAVESAMESVTPESSRGCGISDFDQDGFLDIVIANSDTHVSLLRNTSAVRPESNDQNNNQNWLEIELVGTKVNRDASGAIVTIRSTEGKRQLRLRTGHGYQSGGGAVLHFGLGQANLVESITVDWGTHSQTVKQIRCNQRIIVIEE